MSADIAKYPLGSKIASGASITTFFFFFFLRRMGSWTLVCLASYSFFMPLLKWHLSREAVCSRPGKGHGVLSPWVPTPYGFAPALALLLWQCVCLFVVPQPHDETCAPRG